VLEFFEALHQEPVDLLLLNNVNPVYTNPTTGDIERILQKDALFVVSFSNFMDETTAMADLILPVSLPLEAWEESGG
ncbi:MAG: hypothetical protein NWS07_04335, partial [Desulfobacterales bacterium]|nr:hypothetical protein [Desulfobacterales bacterium]